jgi:hypothetical protein
MNYIFEHIETISIDPSIAGDNESTEITFKCENFLYYARCFQNILQYVKGEDPEEYNNWPIPPTEAEVEAHEDRRHLFNQDHSIVQGWIDTLV